MRGLLVESQLDDPGAAADQAGVEVFGSAGGDQRERRDLAQGVYGDWPRVHAGASEVVGGDDDGGCRRRPKQSHVPNEHVDLLRGLDAANAHDPPAEDRVPCLCFVWARTMESWLQRASAAASLRVTHFLSSVDMTVLILSAATPVAACGMDWSGAPARAQSPAMPTSAGRGLPLDGYPVSRQRECVWAPRGLTHGPGQNSGCQAGWRRFTGDNGRLNGPAPLVAPCCPPLALVAAGSRARKWGGAGGGHPVLPGHLPPQMPGHWTVRAAAGGSAGRQRWPAGAREMGSEHTKSPQVSLEGSRLKQ